MSKSNRTSALGGAVCAVALIATLAGVSLPARVQAADYPGTVIKTAMQPKRDVRAGASGYQLRCWQEGRLIVQENYLQVPPPSASDAMRMEDRDGRPVRVLETANATCLLKAVAEPRRLMRP